jgi:signal transduction histidine kinase
VAELETRFDPAMPPVPLLRNDIGQVILNLVVNAAHAIAELPRDGEQKGAIVITTRREGDRAIIEVSDTGAGIPEAIRGRIFDPFFTTKPVGKGTGQGLAIVYNVVVDKHGGTIEVRSVVGQGSTFIIGLPLDADRRAQAAHTAAA